MLNFSLLKGTGQAWLFFSFSFFFSSWERASQASQGWAWTPKSSVSTFWAMELQTWPPWLVYVVLGDQLRVSWVRARQSFYQLSNITNPWRKSPLTLGKLSPVSQTQGKCYLQGIEDASGWQPSCLYLLTINLKAVPSLLYPPSLCNSKWNPQFTSWKTKLRLLQLFAPYHRPRLRHLPCQIQSLLISFLSVLEMACPDSLGYQILQVYYVLPTHPSKRWPSKRRFGFP